GAWLPCAHGSTRAPPAVAWLAAHRLFTRTVTHAGGRTRTAGVLHMRPPPEHTPIRAAAGPCVRAARAAARNAGARARAGSHAPAPCDLRVADRFPGDARAVGQPRPTRRGADDVLAARARLRLSQPRH